MPEIAVITAVPILRISPDSAERSANHPPANATAKNTTPLITPSITRVESTVRKIDS